MQLFLPKVSIFLHFFKICTHAFAKKAVILQRDLKSPNVGLSKRRKIQDI